VIRSWCCGRRGAGSWNNVLSLSGSTESGVVFVRTSQWVSVGPASGSQWGPASGSLWGPASGSLWDQPVDSRDSAFANAESADGTTYRAQNIVGRSVARSDAAGT